MTVLVGRTHELELLDQALRAARNGAGRFVLLTGEAGIGKSRLVAELCTRATAGQFLILQGHCFEPDLAFPYAPWMDALRAFLAPKSASASSAILGAFAPELVKLLPELALLIPGLQPTPALDPEAEKRRLFESLARFCASLAAKNPLLIVLEDLHWSDESSLDLLHLVARRISALPILLIGTCRTEELSATLSHHLAEWTRSYLVQEIGLAPLTRAEVEQIARMTVGADHILHAGLLEDLVSLSQGNPFFVQEMLKTLQAGESDRRPTPPTIRDLVQRRVEHLGERTRQVLSAAAVIGERFDFGLLQALTAEDEPSLLRALKELIAAQLIVEQSADQFAFRHALTREAVYTSLLGRERQAMHQTIGAALERSAGMHPDALTTQLAYHFYQAGVWHQAFDYSQRAAEQAQALYAPHEALAHYTRALDAAQHLGLSLPVASLRGRALVYEVLGEFDYARADYAAALEAARRGQDRVNEWQLLIDLGLLWQSRDLERAGEYYQRALQLAHDLGDSSILAQTLNRVGNWHLNRGRVHQALPIHQEALELYRRLDDRRGMAQTMDLLGIVNYQLGDAIQGAAYLEQAVPILRELDDRQGLVNTLTNLTVRAVQDTEVLGDINYLQLTGQSDEALEIARGFHWYHGEMIALLQGAISLEQAGEYGRALERLARASSIAQESQNLESVARIQLIYGRIYSGLLAYAKAMQCFETGLQRLQELGSGLLTHGATAQIATLAIQQNDFARARALLAKLLPAEYSGGDQAASLRSYWIAYAELELAQGHPQRALEIVDRLLAATPNLAQYGPQAVPRFSRLRGQALSALKRMPEAASELQGALATAQGQGQRSMVWRLHADLGKVYRAMARREQAGQEFVSARTIIQELADHVPDAALRDQFLQRALAGIPAAPALTPRRIAKKEFGGLTLREREVAGLIAQGRSNRQIADELVISETTAERHVANILSKLGFNSRTQIAVWAVEKGLGQ